MKRQALLILLTLLTTFAFAQPARQDTTTIYINPGYNKDPMRSKWVSKVEQKGDLWELNLFDKKDVLREKINFEDKRLTVRQGPYAFYENNFVKEEGNYDKGYKHGKWRYYHPNQQLLESVNYAWDKFNGLYQAYWDNGELKKEGAYTRGNKIGNWKMFYKNKRLALNEDYDEVGNLIDGIYFDEVGNSVKKNLLCNQQVNLTVWRLFISF